jgi:short-subunit dehydrogenase
MKVQDKVVVVTGAGGGIGTALVLELLKRGAKVAAVDIKKEALEQLLVKVGNQSSKVSTHVLDITKRELVEKLPSEIIKLHGQVDGIINNAGMIHPFKKVHDLDYPKIEQIMNLNFYGTLYMCKSFLPELIKRPTAHILNISSMGGFVPVPGQTIYGASKAAVKLLTEGLHSELIDTTVRVSVVFPGGVKTDITKNAGIDMKMPEDTSKIKVLLPEEAATIILNGMEKDAYRILPGKDSSMIDKIYRISPKQAASMIAKNLKAVMGD